ncbi:MAG: hypothetical protein ACRDPI_02865 [Nocardioidaceae bacterium]
MGIAKWAAVAVTVLMGLANVGLVAEDNLGLKVLGPVLGLMAIVAVVGCATGKAWGTTALIAVGAVNLVGSIVGAIAGFDGWPVGMVLSVLAIVLASVAQPGLRREVTS